MVSLTHTQETETPFSDEFLRSIAEETFRCVILPGLEKKTVSFGAVAMTNKRIQELNKDYRQRDIETDILSFGGERNWIQEGIPENEREIELGDLIYSPEFIRAAAKEDGISDEHEMIYIFSHGILHLLGFDHSDEMFAIQDEVTAVMMKNRV